MVATLDEVDGVDVAEVEEDVVVLEVLASPKLGPPDMFHMVVVTKTKQCNLQFYQKLVQNRNYCKK